MLILNYDFHSRVSSSWNITTFTLIHISRWTPRQMNRKWCVPTDFRISAIIRIKLKFRRDRQTSLSMKGLLDTKSYILHLASTNILLLRAFISKDFNYFLVAYWKLKRGKMLQWLSLCLCFYRWLTEGSLWLVVKYVFRKSWASQCFVKKKLKQLF